MLNAPKRLLLGGLMVAALLPASTQARASVVICERGVSVTQESVAWLEMQRVGSGIEISSNSINQLLIIEVHSGCQPDRSPSPLEAWQLLSSRCPQGMLPSTTSTSQVSGSGVSGVAAKRGVDILPHDSLRATLSPESRTGFPTSPVFRWSRPPRNWL
jgi:hypothetical protein